MKSFESQKPLLTAPLAHAILGEEMREGSSGAQQRRFESAVSGSVGLLMQWRPTGLNIDVHL